MFATTEGMRMETTERPKMSDSLNRRQMARHTCPPKFVTLTWLSEGKTMMTRGYLIDLSMGGAMVMLEGSPEKGRLCRMRIHLSAIGGVEYGNIEMAARVAKRDKAEGEFWQLGFAFDSLTPLAEKALRGAVQSIQAAGAILHGTPE